MSHKIAKRCRKMLRAYGVDWTHADYRFGLNGSMSVRTNELLQYCGRARYKHLKRTLQA